MHPNSEKNLNLLLVMFCFQIKGKIPPHLQPWDIQYASKRNDIKIVFKQIEVKPSSYFDNGYCLYFAARSNPIQNPTKTNYEF